MNRVCKVDNLKTLTYGKSYEIKYTHSGFYLIKNDRDVVRRYSIVNFFDDIEERSFSIDIILT